MQKDIKFVQIATKHNMLGISEQEFERVIDIFEKIVFIDQKQSREYLVTRFYEVAPKDLQERVPKASLELIYNKYWKDDREKRKRSFLRIFWEKADFDDQDPFSAFRKRVKDKMKLRYKAMYEIDSYKKMFEIRANCIDVLHILNDTLKREQIKKRQNLVDQALFEMEFEKFFKDRALNNTMQLPPKVAAQQVMHQKEYKKLEIKIDVKKVYNKNFERYFVNDIPRLFPWLVPPPQPPKPPTPSKPQS